MRFFPPSPAPDVARISGAWREFIAGGKVDSTHVRPHVLRAWKRALSAGCNPRLPRADLLPPRETIALLEHEALLIGVASPFLDALSRAVGDERHAAMLGDGTGRVLKIVGDTATMADDNFPRAGSLLAEEAAGANGIGTALAEGHYVELVGPEHYIEGFHDFTCQGVPLTGTSPQTAGVLSMSVRGLHAAARVRDILFCASEAVECELLAANLSSYLALSTTSSSSLEALRQDIIQGIAKARLQIELAAHKIAAGEGALFSLEAAYELSLKFKRQAAVWRNLADPATGVSEPIMLAELVDSFISLMGTEARVANATLVHGRLDRVLVLDDVRALSQRLLGTLLNVLQTAPTKSEIRLDVFAEEKLGVVLISCSSPTRDRPLHKRTHAPLLR